jgi:hypothetical protein
LLHVLPRRVHIRRTKEMGTKGRRMGVWIRTDGSNPYLSSHVSGSPFSVALRAHVACFAYLDADKWV